MNYYGCGSKPLASEDGHIRHLITDRYAFYEAIKLNDWMWT